jgi:hypothetical protein
MSRVHLSSIPETACRERHTGQQGSALCSLSGWSDELANCTLLTNTSLPLSYWAEAASYSVHVRNRVLDARTRRIPYTVWSSHEVNHQHICPFGCDIHVRDHTQTNKLEAGFKKGILMGWAKDSEHAVNCYDPADKTFNYPCEVIFALLN